MKYCTCGAAIASDKIMCLPCRMAKFGKPLIAPTPNRLRKIILLHKQGVPIAKIAYMTGCNSQCVSVAIRVYQKQYVTERGSE